MHLMGRNLIGMHLIGMYLIGIHLIGIHLKIIFSYCSSEVPRVVARSP
jgi:hypothetical protein